MESTKRNQINWPLSIGHTSSNVTESGNFQEQQHKSCHTTSEYDCDRWMAKICYEQRWRRLVLEKITWHSRYFYVSSHNKQPDVPADFRSHVPWMRPLRTVPASRKWYRRLARLEVKNLSFHLVFPQLLIPTTVYVRSTRCLTAYNTIKIVCVLAHETDQVNN